MVQRNTSTCFRLDVLTLALCALLMSSTLAPSAVFAGETLTLRINDTEVEAGGRVAVVVRTYAPRSISQGQICFRGGGAQETAGGSTPFVTLEEAIVFSEMGDAEVIDSFDGSTQTAIIEFESLSASINRSDGPLMALFFRLDESLAAGQSFDLELDLAETFVVDENGQAIAIEPRSGELTIRAVGDPHVFAVEGDDVAAGEVAALGVETSAIFAIGSGQIALLYDPAFAAGPPVVTMEERHGMSSFTVDTAVPGRAVVTFTSPDGSLNELPGELISIALPTSVSPPGNQTGLTLDPLMTFLETPLGESIPLVLESDVLILNGVTSLIFVDGFESGDLSQW